MYVYIWKDAAEVPFYVGFTKNKRRSNPRNNGNRNWLCKQKLAAVGVENVIVELRPVFSVEAGTALECSLISTIGRVQTGNGPLTNLTSGGDGVHPPTPEHIEKLRLAMLDPNHPVRSPEARAKQRMRMQDADIKALFSGNANPAKKPEVREKLKAKWADPAYKNARIAEKIGRPIHTEEEKQRRREALLDPNNPMRDFHKALNTDPTIAAKRAATLRTPEQRARQSEAMRRYWAKRKESI
jgi:hypothetical protein